MYRASSRVSNLAADLCRPRTTKIEFYLICVRLIFTPIKVQQESVAEGSDAHSRCCFCGIADVGACHVWRRRSAKGNRSRPAHGGCSACVVLTKYGISQERQSSASHGRDCEGRGTLCTDCSRAEHNDSRVGFSSSRAGAEAICCVQ